MESSEEGDGCEKPSVEEEADDYVDVNYFEFLCIVDLKSSVKRSPP